MRTLVSLGVEVNARDQHGPTALFYGCISPELTRFMVERGADANVQDCDGLTALHYVLRTRLSLSFTQIAPILAALFDAGVDDTIRDNEGHTAMHWALQRGFPVWRRECIKLR